MKKFKIFIIFLALFSQIQGNDDLKSYDELFNSINQKRVGLSQNDIKSIQSPFISAQTSKTDNNITEENAENFISYNLYGIVENKAKINDSWYALEEEISNNSGYKLKKINKSSVIISNEYENLELNLTKGKTNVVISNK